MYWTKRFVPFLFLLLLLLLLLGIGSVLLTTNPTAPTTTNPTLNRLPTRLNFSPFVNFFLFFLLITFGKGIIKALRLSRFGSEKEGRGDKLFFWECDTVLCAVALTADALLNWNVQQQFRNTRFVSFRFVSFFTVWKHPIALSPPSRNTKTHPRPSFLSLGSALIGRRSSPFAFSRK